MHRHLYQARDRRQTSRSRCEKSHYFGTGRRRRLDRRDGRQPGVPQTRASGHFERLVHDQLPGPGRLCAASGCGYRARLYDHDPCLYRRPEPPGHIAQRPPPRSCCSAFDEPDLDRRSTAIGLVLPALKGKLDGTAIRVPTVNVSLIDLTFDAANETTVDEVNTLMEDAAKSNRLKGILGINKAPTVSVDFNHDPHSSTFDVTQTQVLDKRFVRVLAWYDNEWGFSNRMVEVAAYFGGLN